MDIIEEALFTADSNGRKLLIATNDTSLHKLFSKSDYKVLNLVGDNMNTKLSPYKYKDKDDEDPNLYDIIMISSKYFVGFDLNNVVVDVLIDTNPHYKHTLIGVNNIVQIIGRPRKGVGRIILCINLLEPEDKDKKVCFNSSISKDDIEKSINNVNPNNWIKEHANIINNWKHYQLRDRKVLENELKRYNINLVKWNDNRTIKNSIIIKKHLWGDKINQLLITDLNELKLDLYNVIKYLKYKDDGIFSSDEALLFYTAIMIKSHNIDIKIQSKDKPSRKYKELNKHIKGDENWDLLYLSYKCRSKLNKDTFEHLDTTTRKEMMDHIKIRSTPSIEMLNSYEDAISCYLDCLKLLKSNKIVIDEKEEKKLEDRCKEYFKKNKTNEIKTEKQLLNSIGYACLLLLDLEHWNTHSYKKEFWDSPLKKNREYNSFTTLPRKLRKSLPIELTEIDINSANPSFIDILVGSDISNIVYENVSKLKNCNRERAKEIYNTFLNYDENTMSDSSKFFESIGYNYEQANKIAKMATNKKGSMYEKMTEIEKQVIDKITNRLKYASDVKLGKRRKNMIIPSYRLHDAIIFKSKYLYQMCKIDNLVKIENKYLKLSFKNFKDGTTIPYGT